MFFLSVIPALFGSWLVQPLILFFLLLEKLGRSTRPGTPIWTSRSGISEQYSRPNTLAIPARGYKRGGDRVTGKTNSRHSRPSEPAESLPSHRLPCSNRPILGLEVTPAKCGRPWHRLPKNPSCAPLPHFTSRSVSEQWTRWRTAIRDSNCGRPFPLTNYPATCCATEMELIFSLGKDSPEPRALQPPEMGSVVELQQVGGLHHRYERRAA